MIKIRYKEIFFIHRIKAAGINYIGNSMCYGVDCRKCIIKPNGTKCLFGNVNFAINRYFIEDLTRKLYKHDK